MAPRASHLLLPLASPRHNTLLWCHTLSLLWQNPGLMPLQWDFFNPTFFHSLGGGREGEGSYSHQFELTSNCCPFRLPLQVQAPRETESLGSGNSLASPLHPFQVFHSRHPQRSPIPALSHSFIRSRFPYLTPFSSCHHGPIPPANWLRRSQGTLGLVVPHC